MSTDPLWSVSYPSASSVLPPRTSANLRPSIAEDGKLFLYLSTDTNAGIGITMSVEQSQALADAINRHNGVAATPRRVNPSDCRPGDLIEIEFPNGDRYRGTVGRYYARSKEYCLAFVLDEGKEWSPYLVGAKVFMIGPGTTEAEREAADLLSKEGLMSWKQAQAALAALRGAGWRHEPVERS